LYDIGFLIFGEVMFILDIDEWNADGVEARMGKANAGNIMGEGFNVAGECFALQEFKG